MRPILPATIRDWVKVRPSRASVVLFMALACGRIDSAAGPSSPCGDTELLNGLDDDCDGLVDECESGIILCDCAGQLGFGTCNGDRGSGPCTVDCEARGGCGSAKGHAVCDENVVQECVPEPIACATSLRSCSVHPGVLDCSGGEPGVCMPGDLEDPDVCSLPGCRGGHGERDTDGNGNPDNDGDALPDCWETEGGIDVDADGTIDLSLPRANPNRKNLYVELDHMPGHCPLADTLERIEVAFGQAPTPSAAGVTPGIILTFEQQSDELPHADYLALTGLGADACTGKARPASSSGADFDQLKSDFFGNAADRALPQPARDRRRLARSFVYRYGVLAHYLEDSPNLVSQANVSGCAELPGNDLIVTVTSSIDSSLRARGASAHDCDGASGATRALCVEAQAGALMHELGHTLGLRHAGASNGPGCKPNYLSVMNYAFEFNFVFASRRLDYSRGQHIRLDESALLESAGLGPNVTAGTHTNFGPSPVTVGCGLLELERPTFVFDVALYSDGPLAINWDRSCESFEGPLGTELREFIDPGVVSVDVNDFGFAECGPSPGEAYDDHDDWANLVYDISRTLEFADGLRSRTFRETLTSAVIHSTDSDADGISNVADNCPFADNPAQLDRNDDGIGDACAVSTFPALSH